MCDVLPFYFIVTVGSALQALTRATVGSTCDWRQRGRRLLGLLLRRRVRLGASVRTGVNGEAGELGALLNLGCGYEVLISVVVHGRSQLILVLIFHLIRFF